MIDLARVTATVLLLCACVSAQDFKTEPVLTQGPVPAPRVEWGEWKPVGNCGGVKFEAAVTNDDGRNDFEVKLRAVNGSGYRAATRYAATILSEKQEKAYRDGGMTIADGKLGEGGSLNLGTPFKSAVNQLTPTVIEKMVLKVDVANLDRPPPNTPPSAYLSPFLDYPVTKCDFEVALGASKSAEKFMSLTDSCVNNLPKWTRPCDDAVDEIISAYEKADEGNKQCVLEWRNYQKCYEIYAFNSSPSPKPVCHRPRCIFSRR